MYKVLILSVKCRLSLPTAKPHRMSAVDAMCYCRKVNEPTGSGNQQLSDKIMTLFLRTWVLSAVQIKCSSFGTKLMMWGLVFKQVCQSPLRKMQLSHKSTLTRGNGFGFMYEVNTQNTMSHAELRHHKVLNFIKYLWGSIVLKCLPELYLLGTELCKFHTQYFLHLLNRIGTTLHYHDSTTMFKVLRLTL